MTKPELESLIAERYESLAPKLKKAARQLLDAPKEIAICSMRSLASKAGVQPSVMLRLAREIGFDNYDSFRAVYVDWLSSGERTFTARAKSLEQRQATKGQATLLTQLYESGVASLDLTLRDENVAAFDAAKKILLTSRRFYVLGLRSLFPAAYLFDYACRLFSDKSVLLTGVGGAMADDELRRATEKDALVTFSFEPYAHMSVEAVRYAKERGVKIIAITDRVVSPIADGASVVILAPSTGSTLFPYIMSAMAIAQALASFMVAAGGEKTLEEIANSEVHLQRLRAYVE